MSNETPQEKYPKFYESPHLWIGAIEVECLKDLNDGDYQQGKHYKFHQDIYNTIYTYSLEKFFVPKFKPQEGERFIKDLESAVSAGVGTQARRIIKSPKNIIAFDAEDKFHQVIMIVENDIKRVTSMLTDFDTAAYVDTLRKLGYYL
jgi:hypothetical protein